MNKKNFKNVLVVLGGTSGERAVSLESGRACIKALKKKGYKVSSFDPKIKNFNLIDKKKTDVIFNALHGRDGEDGIAQSYFEYLRIPYTHSGVISSFNAMNKILSKKIFIKNKIKTPKFFSLKKNTKSELIKKFIKNKKFRYPIVLKPVNEGSSLGVEVCKNKDKLLQKIKKNLKNTMNCFLKNILEGKKFKLQLLMETH